MWIKITKYDLKNATVCSLVLWLYSHSILNFSPVTPVTRKRTDSPSSVQWLKSTKVNTVQQSRGWATRQQASPGAAPFSSARWNRAEKPEIRADFAVVLRGHALENFLLRRSVLSWVKVQARWKECVRWSEWLTSHCQSRFSGRWFSSARAGPYPRSSMAPSPMNGLITCFYPPSEGQRQKITDTRNIFTEDEETENSSQNYSIQAADMWDAAWQRVKAGNRLTC